MAEGSTAAAVVRPARPEDADGIVRLAALLEAEEGTGSCKLRPEHVRAHGFGEGRLFSVIVAERAGSLVGYALFYPSFDVTHAAKGFYLNDLYVTRAERGRRLALAMGYPAYVVADVGHSNGTRLRDYGPFGDPAGRKTAMLVECGQHWARASVEVAVASCLHFLRACDLVAPEHLAGHLPDLPRLPQRVIEVTEAVTVGTVPFRFVDDFRGFEIIPKAGTVLGYAGQRPVRTPYDDCVLVMPSRRLTRGLTAVRLGRFIDG